MQSWGQRGHHQQHQQPGKYSMVIIICDATRTCIICRIIARVGAAGEVNGVLIRCCPLLGMSTPVAALAPAPAASTCCCPLLLILRRQILTACHAAQHVSEELLVRLHGLLQQTTL
jgi:hypothetical protein